MWLRNFFESLLVKVIGNVQQFFIINSQILFHHLNGKIPVSVKPVKTLAVSLDEGLDHRPPLAEVFRSNRDTSLLQLQSERIEIEKLSHAEPFGSTRIGRRGKARLDGTPFHRRDNLG